MSVTATLLRQSSNQRGHWALFSIMKIMPIYTRILRHNVPDVCIFIWCTFNGKVSLIWRKIFKKFIYLHFGCVRQLKSLRKD